MQVDQPVRGHRISIRVDAVLGVLQGEIDRLSWTWNESGNIATFAVAHAGTRRARSRSCQSAFSVMPSPHALSTLLTLPNLSPRSIAAEATQTSSSFLTQSGTGTVRKLQAWF